MAPQAEDQAAPEPRVQAAALVPILIVLLRGDNSAVLDQQAAAAFPGSPVAMGPTGLIQVKMEP